MMIFVGLIVCLLHTFTLSDAAFTWLHHDASVDFIQGQTAKLVWSVDVGSLYTWNRVKIYRNKVKSNDGEDIIIDLKKSDGVKNKHLSGREADIDLVIQGTSNVVNVTFTLHNLVKTTDEKYYRIQLVNSDSDPDSKYTYLRVFVPPSKPVLQIGDPNGLMFCSNDIIRIICTAQAGDPPETNLTIWQNNAIIGLIANQTNAVLTQKLTKAGTDSFSCQATNRVGSSPISAVNITVKDPPVITSCKNAKVVEKDNLVWNCDVNGSLPLTTSWFKGNNNTILHSGNSLNIATVSRADAGMYRFTASNGEGCPNASATVYLDVQFPPSKPVLKIHPNGLMFCSKDIINVTCTAEAGDPPETNWTIWHNNAIHVIGLINNRTSAVLTRKLTKAGTVSFSCQATNLVGSSPISSVNITVKDPPVITSCKNAEVVENDKLVWTCDVSGSQPLTTSWFRGNTSTVLQSGNSLNITTVSRADAGMYRFTASNGEGCPNASTTVYLDVQFPPSKPVLQIDPNRFMFCRDDTINVTCTAEAGDPPETNWTIWQNNAIIGLRAYRTSAVVSRNLTKAGTDSFSCQATNLVGSSPISAVNITVKDPPVITSCKNKKVLEKDKVVWTCNVSGSQPLTTSWFKVNNNTVLQSGNSLNIADVNRNDRGMYRFTASNGEGCSNASTTVYLDVQFPPSKPVLKIHPNQLMFCINDSINVTCTAEAGDPPETNWTIWQNNVIIGLRANPTSAVVTQTLTKAGTVSFSCQATNLVGSSPISAVNITVKDPPVISNCTDKSVVEKKSLHWTCDVSGSQPLTISWFKGNNNTVIQSGNSLNITSVSRADRGMYRFNASNGVECPAASKTVYLDVQFPPLKPVMQTDQLMFCSNNTINVTCTAEAGDPPETNWTIWQNNVIIGLRANRSSAVVTQTLTKAGTVSFSCQATNLVGSSPISAVNITVKDPPVISNCTDEKIVEKKSLHWTCDVSGSLPLTISWFKGNTSTVFQSGKSLSIAAVNRTDHGMYRFTASNGGECPAANKTVYLDVQYKPEQISVDMAQNYFIDIDETESVNITCSAKGNPEPYYHWVFNGQPLSSQRNDTITISTATKKDNDGKYTCTAVNALGNETIAVTVRVHYIGNATCGDAKPDPVKENETLALNCSAPGYPAANYTWTLPGPDVYQQTTTVKATPSLNGFILKCKAMNSRGSRTCTKTITVYYKPRDVQVFPASVPALNISGSFNLTCNASANPDGNYTWSKNGVTLDGKNDRVLTKDNITLEDAGEYTCTVTNSEGIGTSNKVTVNINYKPKMQKCDPVRYLSENSSHVFDCNKADGFPAPSYTALYNGNNYNASVTIDRVTKALNGSVIRCSASNSFGSDSCNTTLIVGYLQACTDTYAFPSDSSFPLKFDGNPVPTVNCSSNSVKHNGINFEIRSRIGVSTCTLDSSVGRCNFTVIVYQRGKAKSQKSSFRLKDKKWNPALGDSKTEDFTRYKKIWEDILARIYENYKYVTKITVLGFWSGSVIVNFELTLIANVSDPLSPLKEEVRQNNGKVDGIAIDLNSIKSGLYVPPTTTSKPITTPSDRLPEAAIIGIAVGCALLILVILLVYCLYFKKRRGSKSEEHQLAEEGENAVPMTARGIDNKGSSPSPSTYAKHGPGANGNNNAGNGDDVYAKVDKSKKTNKPAGSNEDEVTYAVLEYSRTDNKSGDAELAHTPSSGKEPEKYESDYAEITGVIRSSEQPKENESADNSNKNEKNPENAEKESEAEEQAKDKNQDGSPSTSQTAVDNTVKNDNASGSQINVETKGTSAPEYADWPSTKDRDHTTLTNVSM